MRIYIDSNTFPATPGLYADAAKTKPIPRMIPAVELQRGGFEVAFVGSNQPQDIASVSLVASIDGAGVQVVAEQGETVSDDSGDAWRFNFALNAEPLVAEIAKRGSVRLRVGVIVEDDTERREWQFSTVVYPSASSEETDTEAVESTKNFAELAEQAAKRAQEAQADVAGNAQLAEQAKQTAMQAANAAIEAADNAEVSERNAAESKEAAEQAKEDAEAAKTEAKKAASDAQATLGNVYTKAETYSKSQIDGVSTGAELTNAMNKAAEQLLVSQGIFEGFYTALIDILSAWSKTNAAEWDTCFDVLKSAIERFRENPVVDKVYDIDNPPPADTRPFIDFNVLSIGGRAYSDYMSVENRGIFYLPNANVARFFNLTGQTNGVYVSAENATDIQAILRGCKTTGDAYVFAPKSTDAHYLAMGVNAKRIFARLGNITRSNQSFWDSKVDEIFVECDSFDGNYRAFDNSKARKVAIRSGRPISSFSSTFRSMSNLVELEVDLSDATSLSDTLSGSGLFNLPVTISKCKSAQGAFKNTAMSAENISKTLDSLPTWTDGASHVITFTGSPGAAELTQYSPSVAAAIAKGWTVEL